MLFRSREAEKSINRFEQKCYLSQELAHLEKGIQVKASSSICKLNPILDEGMLRVGGRISRLAMPIEMKNPIILPKGSHISMLVLRDIHQRVGHSGRSHMLSQGRCLAGKSGTDSKGPAQRSTAHGPRMAINNIILIFSLQRNGNWK